MNDSNYRARKFWHERKTPCSLPTDIENLAAQFEQVRAEGENAGLEKAAKIIEVRGQKVRGAIDPDITAREVRASKSEPSKES